VPAEHGLDGLPRNPFAPSITQSRPWSHRKPRSTRPRKNSAQTGSFSVAVWTTPRIFFSPCRVMPSAITMQSSANVLPSRNSTTTASWSRRRSLNSFTARALVRMNRRETLEALSPNASGTASAHAS
jgi:hypothetical protein